MASMAKVVEASMADEASRGVVEWAGVADGPPVLVYFIKYVINHFMKYFIKYLIK